MNKKSLNIKHLLTIFSVLLLNHSSFGQVFERAENAVGLSVLSNNSGVSVADYDRDNDLDIFVVSYGIENTDIPSSYSRLFRNNNDGSFTDVTEHSGLTDLITLQDDIVTTFAQHGFKYGSSWGDFDNDGYPDLFLTYSKKVQLWKNLGDGTFDNVTESSGIEVTNDCINTGATWFDYNNDGFLDIYICDWTTCTTNKMYKNNGDETFTDVTHELQLHEAEALASYVAFPFDINNDNWIDLIVTNDLSGPNYAYINNKGLYFSEQATSYGLNSKIDDMGIAISDFDLDSDFDFMTTGIDENSFLVNNGENNFTESSNANMPLSSGWSWGLQFADFDLDMDEDLFILNGMGLLFEQRGPERNIYLKNQAAQNQLLFEDVSEELDLNELTESLAIVDFDYDNDGDLDVIITNSDGPVIFYDNKLITQDESNDDLNWLKIVLEGVVSNRDAIGAKVKLSTTSGELIRHNSGVAFFGQSLKPIHFGLSSMSEINGLEIHWPSGLIENFTNIKSNQTLKATEGQGLVPLNLSPSEKIYGCTDPKSCSYNPLATFNDGSCTYLESNLILGSQNSYFLKLENYSYQAANGSNFFWEVEGGEIIEGQGSNNITVKWNIEPKGSISVVEKNNDCSSLKTKLNINLEAKLSDDLSIARLWNEVLLQSIREDFARPTIHARNLFHTSVAMYDIWAIYSEIATPYLIGNSINGFESKLDKFSPNESIEESVNQAISYAMYRILSHRFKNSPGSERSIQRFKLLMSKLGYNNLLGNMNYQDGNAYELGNYVGQVIIDYGLQDGSREQTGYDNSYYNPINPPLSLDVKAPSLLVDPNRWQPLELNIFIDQGGNIIDGNIPSFLSPEWGNVFPFALDDNDKQIYERDNELYNVFFDPNPPPHLNLENNDSGSDLYKWGFSMVSLWQSHLDPEDGVLWDISPSSIGNLKIDDFPKSFENYPNFYNFFDGGTKNNGHKKNPFTNKPYEKNIVPRGDYTRVLAEFWADGPDSETPPGHWFKILNYVSDHPEFEKKYEGEGKTLSSLEWDVKSYFVLGAGMHDSSIAAWSVKGWYDYIRPVSAIRYLSELGQSTDSSLPNYHISGIPLIEGYIEQINEGDELAGENNQHIGKIKLYTWKGHREIFNPNYDKAGVGWIKASDWVPYQRPTFVTPPFAGYVSGHSVYSRAAAELLTMITGSEFFPGGVGEFLAKANEFLVFEEGPSVDVKLQWATYRDASDQTSLSRIWGGIHPPADDIPGRFIGQLVASDVYEYANRFFEGFHNNIKDISKIIVYPNPTKNNLIFVMNTKETDEFKLFDKFGRVINYDGKTYDSHTKTYKLNVENLPRGIYLLQINSKINRMIIID